MQSANDVSSVRTGYLSTFLMTAAVGAAVLSMGAPASAEDKFGKSYDEIVAMAAKEGPLHICTAAEKGEVDPVFKGFLKMFPNVKEPVYERCNGIERRERILTEYASGQVMTDIFEPGDEIIPRVIESKFAATPNWKVFDGTPLQVAEDDIAKEWDGAMISAGSWSPVIAFSTKATKAEDVPKSFEECADPKWRGKIMVDVRPDSYPFLLDLWGEEKLTKWAKGIAANDPMWTRGSAAFTALSSGERTIHCGFNLAGVLRARAIGATDVGFVFAKETPAILAVKEMIATGTKSPNAALLLLAYWVSKDGQEKVAEGNPGYGSPFVDTTWKAQQLKQQGIKVIPTGWDYFTTAEKATNTIVQAWGFPQATVK